jgi:uncharacterized membrane protein
LDGVQRDPQRTDAPSARQPSAVLWTPVVIESSATIKRAPSVIAWITLNSVAFVAHWDNFPYILLNLAFSTQAAYAAPLILLAQTRQADRDKAAELMAEKRHDEQTHSAERRVAAVKTETDKLTELLQSNTDLTRQDKELTEQVAKLTREIHGLLTNR